jgi:multiple sugar transport system permease protein
MEPSFVGLGSYLRVFSEPRFLQALGRTFTFTLFAVAIEVVLGVAIALILNRAFVGKSVAKLLLLLPLVATPVAVGIVFNLFYDPTIGLLNFALNAGACRRVAGFRAKTPSLRRWCWSMSGSGHP